jgi:hypothetical protein
MSLAVLGFAVCLLCQAVAGEEAQGLIESHRLTALNGLSVHHMSNAFTGRSSIPVMRHNQRRTTCAQSNCDCATVYRGLYVTGTVPLDPRPLLHVHELHL